MRDHCPRCNTRLHPQDVADLFRGRKLDCSSCGASLEARVFESVQWSFGLGLGLAAMAYGWISDHPYRWLPLSVLGLLPFVLHLLPPGLIAGAPWVRIVCKDDRMALPRD